MSKPKIFVGGPIQHAIAMDGSWKLGLRDNLTKILTALRSDEFEVFSAHEHELWGEVDWSGNPASVVQRDFSWMQSADIYAAVLPDENPHCGNPMRSDGTAIELGWASALQKPIALIWNEFGAHSLITRGLSAVTQVASISFEAAMETPSIVPKSLRTLLNRADRI